jgi:hypothetical protein
MIASGEPGTADEIVSILQLAEQAEAFAEKLTHLATITSLARPRSRPAANPTPAFVPPVRAVSAKARVRRYLRQRRARDAAFPAGTFADPAWDILLDLFASDLEGRRVSVSSACIAAAVPPTTALRWIRKLVEDGVLTRVQDPNDGRRVYLSLSEAAWQRMDQWVSEALT